jgi:hypothetical protein
MGNEPGASTAADPVASNTLVELLGSSLHYGGSALSDVPALLKRVLQDQSWRCFRTRLGDLVEYDSDQFPVFVQVDPLRGLGASVKLLEDICGDDLETRNLLDQALQRPHGTNRYSSSRVGESPTLEIPAPPAGGTVEQAIRRLRKDRPDLLQDVIDGEMSPHAAMKEAGFRRRRVSVDVEDAERAARTLRSAMSSDVLGRLADILSAVID